MAVFVKYAFNCPECGEHNSGTTRGEGVSFVLCSRNEYLGKCSGKMKIKKKWIDETEPIDGYECVGFKRIYANGIEAFLPAECLR